MLSAPRPRTLAAWTVVSALALATHYFAGFLILPEAVWLLLRWRDRRQPALAIASLIAVAGALLPLLLKQRRLDLASFISEQSLIGRILRVPKQFAIGYSAPVDTVLAIVAACLLAARPLARIRADDRQGAPRRPRLPDRRGRGCRRAAADGARRRRLPRHAATCSPPGCRR